MTSGKQKDMSDDKEEYDQKLSARPLEDYSSFGDFSSDAASQDDAESSLQQYPSRSRPSLRARDVNTPTPPSVGSTNMMMGLPPVLGAAGIAGDPAFLNGQQNRSAGSMNPGLGMMPDNHLLQAQLMMQQQQMEVMMAAERAALLHQRRNMLAATGAPTGYDGMLPNAAAYMNPSLYARGIPNGSLGNDPRMQPAPLAVAQAEQDEPDFRGGNGISGKDEESDGEDQAKERPRKTVMGDVFEPFPQKLYRMIQEAKDQERDDVISFFPHGRAFVIHKPRVFVAEIIPKYFTTSRMSSFQRQLNLYGFKRITEGPDMGGYAHKFFLKDRPDLCKKIKRRQNAKQRTRDIREPNFYNMPPLSQGGLPCPPPMGLLGGLDPGMAYGGNGMLSNSLIMQQNEAHLKTLQREAALLRQEQAKMRALLIQQSKEEEK